MKRRLVLILAIVGTVLVIGGYKAMKLNKEFAGYASAPEPSATVSSMKAAYSDWNPTMKAVGSLRAVRGVDLAVETAGLVHAIRFGSGQDVAQGTTLLELVNDADRARLASLETGKALAEANFGRAEKQFADQIISQAELDSSRANRDAAVAAVREQQAEIAKKTLRAPFAGRLGITTLSPGQYLQPGQKVVTLQQIDPIHADFTVPQSAMAQVSVGQAVTALADNGEKVTGKIVAVEPAVDTATRNIKVLATLANSDGKLLPGMFARIEVANGAPQRYLTLPATAITFNPYGETVYVVMDGEAFAKEQAAKQGEQAAPTGPVPPPVDEQGNRRRVAKQVFVTTGPARGDQVAVLTGIQEGDEVVTSGQLKLRNGLKVLVDNSTAPANDPAPKPVDH
jgi:membrane fusion protein (multidrug efflux system)